MKRVLIASFAFLSFAGYSQTAPTTAPAAKEWDVSIYGFVRTDYIWDTRKSAQVREYNLNLYPLDEVKDANGKYWYFPMAQLTATGEGSGTAKADGSKYSVTFVAENEFLAKEVDASIIAGLL